MDTINGSDMMLFADSKSIAGATSCKLSITAETADVSCKDVGGDWGSSTVKKLNFEASTENLFIKGNAGKTFDDLFALMIAKKPIDVAFSLDKAEADKTKAEVPETGWTLPTAGLYKGKAIITSLEANAPNGDNATYSANFKGAGALEQVKANA